MAVSQTTYTLVVRHAVSVVAREKKASSTASTVPTTHVKAIGHGFGRNRRRCRPGKLFGNQEHEDAAN